MVTPPRPSAWFFARSAWQRLVVEVHRLLRIDRRYRVGRYEVRLPPAHRLPWFQALFPTYDAYAAPLLTELCRSFRRPVLLDIGANVGDTTLLALDAVAHLDVVAVEGDATFLRYLRRNTAQVADRVRVVPRFVTPAGLSGVRFASGGSTGGFRSDASSSTAADLTVTELLDSVAGDLVVWKSDTDGLDVTLLADAWPLVDERCAVVWFELDPALDVDCGRRIPELIADIAASGRTALVYDNTGTFVATLPADEIGGELQRLLADLRTSKKRVVYYDVWTIDTRRVPVPLSGVRSFG